MNPIHPPLRKLPLLLGVATVLIAGCEKNEEAAYFRAPEERPALRLMERQADLGAAKDATLYAHHFDGAVLNSLGHEKLQRMERGTPGTQDMIVYLDLPADQKLTAERRADVARYVTSLGVPQDRVQYVEGPNPNTHPAAPRRQAPAGGGLGGESDTFTTDGFTTESVGSGPA